MTQLMIPNLKGVNRMSEIDLDNIITLNDAFPNGFTGEGIFSEMVTPPFPTGYDADEMDIMFFSEYGQKPISPLVEHFNTDTGLSETNRILLATLCLSRFQTSWEHQNDLMSASYDPIENYNLTENENIDKTLDIDTTNTLDRDGTSSSDNDIYAFNSVDAVPSDKNTGSTTMDGTDIVDSTEVTDEDRTLTRTGNIGVTTTQQMIQQELDLWKWNFMTDIFIDVASLLTLSVY